MTSPAIQESTHSNDTTQLDLARQLVEALEQGNEEKAEDSLSSLADMRESHLFQEMGRLTRQLHDAINGVESDESLSKLAVDEMPEARERLHYVVKLTEDSANRTMNAVEASMPVSDQLVNRSEELSETWTRFTKRELDASEFRELSKEVESFFKEVTQNSMIVRSHLTDILMAQDFQDLTGQVIKRVTDMVEELEASLVDIIRKNGKENEQDTIKNEQETDVKAEGPQMNAETRDDVVSGQDDVDDLLSSLGF